MPEIPTTATDKQISRQIIAIVFLTFICYLTIGLPLAVLPSYVHGDLGFGSIPAGLVISTQYISTLMSRSMAGRMADTVGPKKTVLIGLVAAGASGLFLLLAALTKSTPLLSLCMLFVSRLILGCAESGVGTGAIAWGMRRVGNPHTAKVISFNGIATYGALAVGAPLGVTLEQYLGLSSLGMVVMLLGVVGFALAWGKPAVSIVKGERLPFSSVLGRVFPHGMGLALGSCGFGVIATFITLYYASQHWANASLTLSLFGCAFIGARLLFANSINQYGGFKTATISLTVEAIGLFLLWQAAHPGVAMLGAALTGFGFALVFPALGVEAVALVPPASRGAAIGVYSVFLDVALGLTGPVAGAIAGQWGYPSIFLFAGIAVSVAVILTRIMHKQAKAKRTLTSQ